MGEIDGAATETGGGPVADAYCSSTELFSILTFDIEFDTLASHLDRRGSYTNTGH
ncbi:hypothetical protein JMUB6875_40570 [Nocardia sp. JMUB6875]